MPRYKLIIGRTEPMEIIGIISGVPAKTDTGAYTSAIHATDIREVKKPNGKKVLQFTILSGHPTVDSGAQMEVSSYATTIVENSFGHEQQRYLIILKVKIAGRTFRAPFTLADRSRKAFPVLLGRTLLNKRFIVDSTLAHVDRKVLKSRVREWLAEDDREDQADQ